MKKPITSTYQEYHRDGKLIREYGFPPENVVIALEEIETKFGKDILETVNRADGWILVIFQEGDARHTDFLYNNVMDTIRSRIAKRNSDVTHLPPMDAKVKAHQ